jgi:hypothetical protein
MVTGGRYARLVFGKVMVAEGDLPKERQKGRRLNFGQYCVILYGKP